MWEDETADTARRKLYWWIGGLVVVAAAGFALWYEFLFHPAGPAPAPATAAVEHPLPSTPPPVEHPLPSAANAEALPALNDSDQLVQDSLTGVLGRPTIETLLVPQNIVRHIVVTVDNLSRHKTAPELRPIKPTGGQTVVSTQGDLTVLSEANFERYTTLAHAVQATDVKALAALYQRLYPLFQQAYEDLG